MSQPAVGIVSPDYVKLIDRVSSIVHAISGNRLGEKQSYMIETRLKKRMMELGIKSATDYLNYIDQHQEKESAILVGLITTHHTFFFREFPHFEILKIKLPDIVNEVKKRGEKTIKVWSTACSRGQEVYSIAMFLDYYLSQIDPTMNYKILGTDIDNESVKIAQNGVYHQNEIKEIPMNFMGSHWARGTGDIAMYAKVKNTIKTKCEFKFGNLLKINETVQAEKFDIVFCRNVFIYFESHQVEQISKDLLSHMYPGGIFFSGISEPLSGLKLEVNSIGPSAYTLKSAKDSVTAIKTANHVGIQQPLVNKEINVSTPDILRVMCVDDSPSILQLLKKVLSKEEGFEVVATAVNGRDAIEKLKTIKVDIVTLDIHMPEMDGISYLERNFSKSHPPVVMISSASRADSDVAMKALKLGASDYVEKPALNNLEERGEEIRTKLKSVAFDFNRKPVISTFDKESQKSFLIGSPEKKIRILLASISDFGRIKSFFRELDRSQPATFLFLEGHGEILEAIVKEHSREFTQKMIFYNGDEIKIESNAIYVADFKTCFLNISKRYTGTPTSILCFGNISSHAAKCVGEWRNAQLLIEDLGDKLNKAHSLRAISTDVVPVTSYAYMSCRYLSTK